MATLDCENYGIHETPTLNNNVINNKHNGYGNHILSKINDKFVGYFSIYTIFQILGILLMLSVFFWLQFYRNGFGFSGTVNVCNWHPLLMTITFTYLFANSILHFRSFRNTKKKNLKRQHVIMHSSIVVFGLIGVWTGLNSNIIANPSIPKFYSLHSWMGIVTVILFLSQFASGFVSFFYPEIAIQYKKVIMPYHIFVGVLTFVLSIVTSVLGFSEKIMFALYVKIANQQDKYMPTEGLFLNCVAFLLIFYGVLVVYILIKPEDKRPSKPKDMIILTHTGNIGTF